MSRVAPGTVLSLLLVAAASSPARADGPASGAVLDVPAPPATRSWYGWQVLAVDAASLGATAGCLSSDTMSKSVCNLPIAGYLLGGPLVHTAHRGWGRGLASLGARIALPLIGGVIGVASSSCPQGGTDGLDFCRVDALGMGILIGTATAVAVDSVFAFDAGEPEPRTPPRASLSISPALTFNRDAAGVGLSGRF